MGMIGRPGMRFAAPAQRGAAQRLLHAPWLAENNIDSSRLAHLPRDTGKPIAVAVHHSFGSAEMPVGLCTGTVQNHKTLV